MSYRPDRVAILVSGQGSLMNSLLEAIVREIVMASAVVVISDRDCPALEKAASATVPVDIVSPNDYPDRAAWDEALADTVAMYQPDWVLSLGFMRILGPDFLARFHHKVINTHPALLPSFPGAHAVKDALEHGVKVTGCTVHFVDEGVDTGPIIAQEAVPVKAQDTLESLHERIKTTERRLILDVVADAVANRIHITGRKVTRQ